MISICDVGKQDGEIVVVNQRDWTVPNFHQNDIVVLCKYTAANGNCDSDCPKCVITRLLEERDNS